MKLLSVVVPVYNVEMYLERCINMLLGFDPSYVDIILVDDGSTDDSGTICDNYATISNFSIIHKENGGLSDARNAGLQLVNSEYVWFVDSDDYIEKDKCKDILERLQFSRPDILVMNYSKDMNGIKKPFIHSIPNGTILSGIEYMKRAIKCSEYVIPVWSNVYKYDLFLNLNFKKGIYHEDELITPHLFLKSNKVFVSNISAYNYVYRENSIVNSEKYKKNITDMFEVFTENCKFFENYVDDCDLLFLLKNDIAEKIVYTLSRYNISNKDIERYISYDFISRCSLNLKNKLRYVVFRYFRWLYRMIYCLNERRKSV